MADGRFMVDFMLQPSLAKTLLNDGYVSSDFLCVTYYWLDLDM